MTNLRILHLTDTHLFGDDTKHYGVVDTADHLRRALDHMSAQQFDLVVCSGDVSEDGTEASYERALDQIGSWATERGARSLFVMGNHDRRPEFRAVLGGGQPGVDSAVFAGGSTAPLTPIASAVTVDGWRTIALDTTVPGAGYGALDQEQLDWLAGVLSEPAEHGTVIVMHHAPVDAQTDLLQALALGDDDAARFWDALRGSDVKAVLSGHYHLPIVETIDGVPVIVAPGVSNIARSFDARNEESASDSFGGAAIEVSNRRVRVVPFVEPVTGDEVFRFSASDVERIIKAAGRPSV